MLSQLDVHTTIPFTEFMKTNCTSLMNFNVRRRRILFDQLRVFDLWWKGWVRRVK
jgi:hypothetical protein